MQKEKKQSVSKKQNSTRSIRPETSEVTDDESTQNEPIQSNLSENEPTLPQPKRSSQPKRSRLQLSSIETIDPNTCCMCFTSYKDDVYEGLGAEWISCPCGRWLHEDCAEDCL